MRVKQVSVRNFKRLESLDTVLRHFDCLVGANNSGKSTLLQALALFDFCVQNCLSRKNGSDQIELKHRSIAPEEFYVLPVSTPTDLWTNRRTLLRKQHIKIEITITFDDEHDHSVTTSIDLNYNRFALQVDTQDASQQWLQELQQFRIAYLPVYSSFLPREERRTRAVIEDELARGRVNSVIRNLLLDLKDQAQHESLIAILQRSFPDLRDVNIQFDEISDRHISVTYQEQGRPKEFDVFSAGSGFQQFVYLFGFILLRRPTLILLDEPDVHLHGKLQSALLSELKSLVEQGKQILFATHSGDLIRQMSPEDILVLEEGTAKRLQVNFDVYDALTSLGSVEITQLPIIQAYRRIVVVENETDWNLLSLFLARILTEPVWTQVERRLAVVYSFGNPWKQDMARLQKQIQQMISAQGQTPQLFVIADRDYHPDLIALRQSLPTAHIQWHIWERTEIENYLLSYTAVRRLLINSENETLFDLLLKQEFDALLQASRDDANDKLVKAFQEYGRSLKAQWDVAALSSKAREYLNNHWDNERLYLADAKERVLPGLKQWAQRQGLGQFSDRKLAESLFGDELPEEVHQLAARITQFAGIAHS